MSRAYLFYRAVAKYVAGFAMRTFRYLWYFFFYKNRLFLSQAVAQYCAWNAMIEMCFMLFILFFPKISLFLLFRKL